MGFIDKLFGSPALLKDVVSDAASALDKLKYTAEEKADDAAAARKQEASIRRAEAKIRLAAQHEVVEWMKATAPMAETRRYLAKNTFRLWMWSIVAAMTMEVSSGFIPQYHQLSVSLSTAAGNIDMRMADVDQYMLLIYGFYLAGPHVADAFGRITANLLGRRGGDKPPPQPGRTLLPHPQGDYS